jgi:hypothetical protein
MDQRWLPSRMHSNEKGAGHSHLRRRFAFSLKSRRPSTSGTLVAQSAARWRHWKGTPVHNHIETV